MRWLVVLVGCANHVVLDNSTCVLGPDEVSCTAVNHTLRFNKIVSCIDIYIVVRDSGLVIRDRPCSQALAWDQRVTFPSKLPMPSTYCGDDLRNCAFRTFLGAGHDREKVTFIREVQDGATALDTSFPSVRECARAVIGWHANPQIHVELERITDAEILDCITRPRASFECMLVAASQDDLRTCR